MAFEKMDYVASVVSVSLFLVLTGWIFLRISYIQPGAYMDEIFHVPQAQNYCAGVYSYWDPMITTLPGLYLISTGLLQPIGTALSLASTEFCSTTWLRSLNVLFISAILFVIHRIMGRLHSHTSTSSHYIVVTAVTLTTLPVLYFFSFLYYTDCGSTFFVLFAYLLSLHRLHWCAAASGAAAIMFRQTNVVWVAFFAAITVIDILKREFAQKKDDSSALRNDKLTLGDDRSTLWDDRDEGMDALTAALDRIWKNPSSCVSIIRSLFFAVLPYALTVLSFVFFIYVNNGIVLGAKTDHQAALHIPQMFYFFTFVGTFSFMHLLDNRVAADTVNFVRTHTKTVVIATLIAGISVWKLTFVHRYILADNRHYTFYIWARIFRPYPLMRYALIPAYLFVAFAMCRVLSRRRSNALWTMAYFLCLFVNLVPSTLLELRYFIVPYLLFRLNVPALAANYSRLVLELSVHVVVNLLTFYMFMYRPFLWENSEDVQRFMW